MIDARSLQEHPLIEMVRREDTQDLTDVRREISPWHGDPFFVALDGVRGGVAVEREVGVSLGASQVQEGGYDRARGAVGVWEEGGLGNDAGAAGEGDFGEET